MLEGRRGGRSICDDIIDADMSACRDKVASDTRKWNKDGDGTWRIDLGHYDYGV